MVSFSLWVFWLYQGSSWPGLLCHTYLSVVHTRALLTRIHRYTRRKALMDLGHKATTQVTARADISPSPFVMSLVRIPV